MRLSQLTLAPLGQLALTADEETALLAEYIRYMYHCCVSFEFDPKKAAANLRKHGVSFAEAEPVLYDPRAMTREDADAAGEPRLVTVGTGAFGRVLTLCWTERELAPRLISARLATAHERKCYES